MDNDGRFLSFVSFADKYNLVPNFLQYYSLCNAIPAQWKYKLRNENNVLLNRDEISLSIRGKDVPITKASCKDFYWIFVENRFQTPTCISKWCYILNDDIDLNMFSKISLLPYKCCSDTKLQSFQYKLLHRFIVHNKRLCKIKILSSPKCKICELHDETIEHKFFECNTVSIFWNDFRLWWNSLDILTIEAFTCKNVIFGFYERNCETLNYCILFAKYFIHVSSLSNTPVQFKTYKRLLKNEIETFRHILCFMKKLDKFDAFWLPVLLNLE